MKLQPLRIRYRPTVPAALAFLVLVAMAATLFLIRAKPAVRPAWVLDFVPDFYHHISNGALSFILCATAGYVLLMLGARLWLIILMAALLVVVNFIFELLLLVGNVPDPADAWYGTAGTVAAVVFLMWVKGYGLRRRV